MRTSPPKNATATLKELLTAPQARVDLPIPARGQGKRRRTTAQTPSPAAITRNVADFKALGVEVLNPFGK